MYVMQNDWECNLLLEYLREIKTRIPNSYIIFTELTARFLLMLLRPVHIYHLINEVPSISLSIKIYWPSQDYITCAPMEQQNFSGACSYRRLNVTKA